MSVRTMYDSARPAGIPRDAAMVAGYVDGDFAWPDDAWLRFPRAAHVRISVEPFGPTGAPTGFPFGDYQDASVLDIEARAFPVTAAPRFIASRNLFRPHSATIYGSRSSTWPQVLRHARGLEYWAWVAWYWGRGEPKLSDAETMAQEMGLEAFGVRLAAWQWRSGNLFDTSIVVDDDWHPEPS